MKLKSFASAIVAAFFMSSAALALPVPLYDNHAPTVNNNTALSALRVAGGPPAVNRLGYAAKGDAPTTIYNASNSACSLNSGAGDGGSQVPSADGKCWVASFDGPTDIRIWGADATGSVAAESAIQAAINSSGRCDLYIPTGTFKLMGQIIVSKPCVFNAVGVFSVGVATGNIFVASGSDISAGTTIRFSGLRFTSSVTRTGGAYIQCTKVCIVEKGTMQGHAIGIDINGGTQSVVRDMSFRNATPEAAYADSTHIWVRGLATAVLIDSVISFTDTQLAADQPRSCLHVTNTDALIVSNVDLILCRSVLLIDPQAGENVLSTQINGGFYDTPKGSNSAALEITTRGGNVVRFKATGAWFGDSAGGDAVRLNINTTGSMNTISFVNSTLAGVNGSPYGLNIMSQFIHDVSFIGGCINGFSTAAVRAVSGVNSVRIQGVSFGDTVGSCIGPQTPTGIVVEGAASYWDISHNMMRGLTTKISGAANLANSFVTYNQGYNPVGSSSITVGSSPYTYCAGPSPETIYVVGGTVSQIITQTSSTGLTSGSFSLGPGECLGVTFSSAPFMTKSVH